jgi:adenosine deaminase
MTTDAPERDFSAVPKVELHHHLDLSVSYRVARRIAPTLTIDQYRSTLVGPPRCEDLSAFLASTTAQVDLLQTPWALRIHTSSVLSDLERENVVCAELRFAPLLHDRQGMRPEQAVEAVLGAIERWPGEIRIGIILTTLRHFTAEQSLATARLAVRFAGAGVVGFDLGGDEAGFPLDPHLPAFDVVRQAGLSCTVHAGEGAGAGSVREVLDRLSPARLGHGVRSVEDPELVARIIEEGVHLEICPRCNVQLGVVPSLQSHPIDVLYRRGVQLSVSTDSRTATPTDLAMEYEALADAFGWEVAEFEATNHMAAAALFGPAELRRSVHDTIRMAKGSLPPGKADSG